MFSALVFELLFFLYSVIHSLIIHSSSEQDILDGDNKIDWFSLDVIISEQKEKKEIMSDDEFSPLAKRPKSETTNDLEVSPYLSHTDQDKLVSFSWSIRSSSRNHFSLLSFSYISESKVIDGIDR